MTNYIAYGLLIQSDIPFPELVSAPQNDTEVRDPDVRIECGIVKLSEVQEAEQYQSQSVYGQLNDGIPLANFWVRGGNLIRIQPLEGIEMERIRPIILGPMLSTLLRQRGFLVLHASSVLLEETAIVFMGHSGAGKSTLATALNQQGYSLITDDVTALHWDPKIEKWRVMAGYPNVRLLPDSAEYFGYTFDKLPLIHPLALKRNKPLSERFAQQSHPLGRIYVLDDNFGATTRSQLLSQEAAVLDLIRYTRVSHLLRDANHLQAHLEQCTRLVKQVSVTRLHRQRSLQCLPEIIALLQSEVGIPTTNKAPIFRATNPLEDPSRSAV